MRDRVYQSLHTFCNYNFFFYLFVLLEFTKRKMKNKLTPFGTVIALF